jgi:hypothetical protein
MASAMSAGERLWGSTSAEGMPTRMPTRARGTTITRRARFRIRCGALLAASTSARSCPSIRCLLRRRAAALRQRCSPSSSALHGSLSLLLALLVWYKSANTGTKVRMLTLGERSLRVFGRPRGAGAAAAVAETALLLLSLLALLAQKYKY